MMTRTCIPSSNARYSAVVRPRRGVAIRSTAGSSARLRKTTADFSAPVLSNSFMNMCFSSLVIPMAMNTTANSSSVPRTFACLAIWSATSLWGRPDAEKIGSFCPLTRVFIPSMVEIPVWMKSEGLSLAHGLMAAPLMSSFFSGVMAGPPSRGCPDPDRTRPIMSLDTGIFIVSPRNLTVASLSIPEVPSKIWTQTKSSEESRTCPLFMVPSESLTLTSSSYPMGSVFSTKTRGPSIRVTVLYSFSAIFMPPVP